MQIDRTGIIDARPDLATDHIFSIRHFKLKFPLLWQSALEGSFEWLRLLMKIILPQTHKTSLHFANIAEPKCLVAD